jgi:uncharacterized protein (DUF362 family)
MNPSVSIVRCCNYDEEEVESAVRKAVDLIGGMGAFVRPGARVLLKPNCLFGKAPEKAVTTHPSVVKAVIRLVQEAGGKPTLGESPGVGSFARAAEKCGIRNVAEETGCPMMEFNRPCPAPGRDGQAFRQIGIDQAVFDADVLINLPKWKSHGMTLLTLGVKNLFGCVPGHDKALWHLRAGEDRKRFSRMLVDLYQAIRPALTVLDGVVGMEGDGPSSGNPIALGLIVAGSDALAVDLTVCDLLGIPRERLMSNRVAFEAGLGRGEIDLQGEPVSGARISRFHFPTLSEPDWNLPGVLKKFLKNAFTAKPAVRLESCKKCRRCAEICPPKALEMKEAGPAFLYGKCIRCFCCQEICPEGAIRIEPGWGLRLIGRGRKVERG